MAIEAIKGVTGGYYDAVKPVSNGAGNISNVGSSAETESKQSNQRPQESFSISDSGKAENNNTANSMEAVKKAVEKINDKMENSVAQFGIHEATNRVMIKIVDKDTKKVIKEFPPEETLDMIARAWELAGIMVDEKR